MCQGVRKPFPRGDVWVPPFLKNIQSWRLALSCFCWVLLAPWDDALKWPGATYTNGPAVLLAPWGWCLKPAWPETQATYINGPACARQLFSRKFASWVLIFWKPWTSHGHAQGFFSRKVGPLTFRSPESLTGMLEFFFWTPRCFGSPGIPTGVLKDVFLSGKSGPLIYPENTLMCHVRAKGPMG